MNKMYALLITCVVVFTACEQPTDNNPGVKLPSLTIRNESSFDLTDVKFSGISFAAVSGSNDLPRSNHSVKQLTENDLNKAGYITFTRKDIGIACRTEAISIGSDDYTFTFLDTSVVEEIANSANKKSLAQITFVSEVTVERGGLTVAKNDTENLGEAIINIEKSTEFILKNTGVGKLLLTGTEPVKIIGTGEGAFSVVQPSSSEIAPNGSLTFRINFTPGEVQDYSATVTISSNDPNDDFTFTITAVGVPPKPIASVFYENTEIPQNGTIDAGEVNITQSKNITIVIKNTGTEVLTIDTANIAITGADADVFIKLTNPGGNISMGNQSSFLIECTPAKQGESHATLTIPTNDSSRNNIVIYLRIEAVISYIVSYDTNGGIGLVPGVQTIPDGSSVVLPDENGFLRSGYTFDGWSTDVSGDGNNYDVGSSYTPTGNITFYARWYSAVTFSANGGSGTTPSTQTANAGSSITLPNGSDLTRGGYTFGGWNTAGSGDGSNHDAGSSYTPTGNITLYARWYCTVTYDTNGGSGTTPVAQTANAGSSITLPDGNGFSKSDYTFVGWNTNAFATGTNYSAGSSYTVSGNITLYAKWDGPVNVPGANLAAKLSWLQSNAQSGEDYIIEVTANESIGPQTLSYSGRSNISITLRGTGTMRTVSLSANGSLFTISSGVSLMLDDNITLRGRSANNAGLVRVNSSGTFTMNSGAVITGNTTTGFGGGVYVASSTGIFTMSGGKITENTTSLFGGGVFVSSGTFTMSGGEIMGNTASTNGGGVYVNSSTGTFTMNGGTISGNTTNGGGSTSYGGGVYVSEGSFTMNGGTISGNTTSGSSSNKNGGGVFVMSGTFTMNGGEITGNTASTNGGGVYVAQAGTFTMTDGIISGNTTTNGGGVYMDNQTFTMEGGEISGNSASNSGGGVYVNSSSSGNTQFRKTSGTIYGYTAGDSNSNTVKNSSGVIQDNRGHAVYAYSSSTTKRKETTAGPSVNLSWNYNNGSPTFSGSWDY